MPKYSLTYLNIILPFCLFLSVFTVPLCMAVEDTAETTESSANKQNTKTGIINANILNVRARPGTNYEVVGKLRKGSEVEIVSKKDDWYEIRPPAGVEAWCAKKYLSSEGEVLSEKLRIRAGPGVFFSTYGRLPKGIKVVTKGRDSEEWQLIKPPPQATVWVSAEYVKETEKAEEEDHDEPIQEDENAVRDVTDEIAEEQVETEEETERAAESEPKDKNTVGILIPLKDQKVGNITHALADIRGHSAYPKLLLQSSKINFLQWEYKQVRVYGRKTGQRKNNQDVYAVTGIKLVNP